MKKVWMGAMILVALMALGCATTEQKGKGEGPGSIVTSDSAEAQRIVDKAKTTLDHFMADQNFTWLRENLRNARGLLIFPQVLKAGFLVGGSGGTGVLLVRDENSGDWSEPCFYAVSSVTFGLQIGAEAVEVIMTAMTQKGIDSLYTSSFKLGGDISAAAGLQGGGVKADISADFISFVRAKGIFIGMDVEGSAISVGKSLNSAYYDQDITPIEIIVQKKVRNRGTTELRATLRKAAS